MFRPDHLRSLTIRSNYLFFLLRCSTFNDRRRIESKKHENRHLGLIAIFTYIYLSPCQVTRESPGQIPRDPHFDPDLQFISTWSSIHLSSKSKFCCALAILRFSPAPPRFNERYRPSMCPRYAFQADLDIDEYVISSHQAWF